MNINNLLKEKNLKVTKNRRIILEALQNIADPVSAEELFDKLKADYDVDLSTIYRNLNILEEKNLLLKSTNLDGINYYQINNSKHKHFITCNICQKNLLLKTALSMIWKKVFKKKQVLYLMGIILNLQVFAQTAK